jgi:hypothetical protein
MKRIIYGTIILFVVIIIIVIVTALMTPVQMIRYEDGVIIEESNE